MEDVLGEIDGVYQYVLERTTYLVPRPFALAGEKKISSRAGRQNAAGRELAAGEVYLVAQNRDKCAHKRLIQRPCRCTQVSSARRSVEHVTAVKFGETDSSATYSVFWGFPQNGSTWVNMGRLILISLVNTLSSMYNNLY